MKVTLELDGRPTVVDVDLGAGTARVGEHTYPIKVLHEGPAKVEVEVAGQRVVIEGWYEGILSPADPVTVNGERIRVRAQTHGSSATLAVPAAAPPPAAAAPARAASTPGGSPVSSPMPGKVVELRVALGDRVEAGQVLLVLEAMKMRNEILSPSAGTVIELSVAAGANVRARETMLVIGPG